MKETIISVADFVKRVSTNDNFDDIFLICNAIFISSVVSKQYINVYCFYKFSLDYLYNSVQQNDQVKMYQVISILEMLNLRPTNFSQLNKVQIPLPYYMFIDKAAEILKDERKETANGPDLRLYGFPPLGEINEPYEGLQIYSQSKSSSKTTYLSVAIKERTFRNIDGLILQKCYSSLHKALLKGSALRWENQAKISYYVQMGLIDVFSLLQMSSILSFDLQMILHEQPEIIAIKKYTDKIPLPICVVEVKQPNTDSKTKREEWDQWVAQLYDYMYLIPYKFQTRFSFGILTTYEEWQFFWFEDTDNIAESDGYLPENVFKEFQMLNPKDEREIHCSRIYKCNDLNLIQTLTSFINKANHYSQYRQNLPCPYTQFLTNTDWRWEIVNLKTNLSYSSNAVFNQKNGYFILKKLQHGRDGRVYITSTIDGVIVVVKFSQLKEPNEQRQSLQREASYWNILYYDINKQVAFNQVLNNQYVLIMPYVLRAQLVVNCESLITKIVFKLVEGVGINKKLQLILLEEPLTLALNAINYMVKKEFFHNDIQWRHLALMISGDQNELLPIFIDLTDVSKKINIGTQLENDAQYIEKQMTILKSTLSIKCFVTIE
ncbi:Conserved_hypothetical protein [Hexamita inflata]|uniref:DUF5898 domain-containing protein n=1 Tax=Hexamita inflata TaxID=28002 RepID=A0AA86QV38_9EUKA|nr:Conserved hypothetical protein [Hexamita inflata]